MYKRLPDIAAAARAIEVTIDGEAFAAREGDTVAAALLAAGYDACRTTPVTGAPRGPFCLMGVCFDCLAVIDGRPNQQTCLLPVRAGMRIERQQGAAAFGPNAGPAKGTP
jgi:predicted molibdopterin-dependent oxidoreductase YjgC